MTKYNIENRSLVVGPYLFKEGWQRVELAFDIQYTGLIDEEILAEIPGWFKPLLMEKPMGLKKGEVWQADGISIDTKGNVGIGK